MILESERLTLNLVTALDIGNVHVLHSLPEVDEYNTLGIPKNIEETKSLVENWILENKKQGIQRFTFSVKVQSNDEFIGLIGINIGKAAYKNAEVWFKFHPKFWNKGYATEALKTILKFGFQELKLHRIEACCAVGNIGSMKVLEKVGMLREAHTRKLLPLKSGWSDNYGYAKLSTD
ncbi:GNAT family N-acetyltransferase [Frigoriflavimonas asaccharolytica]|uniref:RimJ/RimL family protein N-acetyltransferase n=1 Tax=Frigoriflavimonas asaccharolytica TaxID=2735899 RepID=A0A8J8G8A9_9FLAO|nr:GNAT family N-acetyltransferase [Frigoriflavimonas asaccharolytica]NRS91782.1 RimJ/RimL family protein N-acetyltransferase [Frigoriflavimonas asaccharolytica]